jgi:hypothetical protein
VIISHNVGVGSTEARDCNSNKVKAVNPGLSILSPSSIEAILSRYMKDIIYASFVSYDWLDSEHGYPHAP